MTYDAISRYQFQPWYIKAYRWIKYMPLAYCAAVRNVALWVVAGCPRATELMTRWQSLAFAWRMHINLGHIHMGNWVTLNECMDQLRKSAPAQGASE